MEEGGGINYSYFICHLKLCDQVRRNVTDTCQSIGFESYRLDGHLYPFSLLFAKVNTEKTTFVRELLVQFKLLYSFTLSPHMILPTSENTQKRNCSCKFTCLYTFIFNNVSIIIICVGRRRKS